MPSKSAVTHADAAIYAKESFYFGALTFAFGRSLYTRAMHLWILDACGQSYNQRSQPQSNMVFVNVKGGCSDPSDTSFINTANARFVVEFAANLIRPALLYSLQHFIEWERTCVDKSDGTVPPLPLGKILIITGYRQQKRLLEQMLGSYRLMKSAITPLTCEPLTTHRALKQRSSYGIWFVQTSRGF